MTDFKRHLPTDTSLPSIHVALGRIWDAMEANTGGGSQPQPRNLLSSPSVSGGTSGGGGSTPGGGTPAPTRHNNLSDIQGGSPDNYYHLLNAEYTGSGTGTFIRQTTAYLINPTATTPALVDNSTLIATTAFVKKQNYITMGLAYQLFLQRVYVTSPLGGSGTQSDPLTMGNVNSTGSTLFLYNNCGGL